MEKNNLLGKTVIQFFTTDDNTVIGMGVVLDKDKILTCAHVISALLKKEEKNIEKPNDTELGKLRFSFPLNEELHGVEYKVEKVIDWGQKNKYELGDDYIILKPKFNPNTSKLFNQIEIANIISGKEGKTYSSAHSELGVNVNILIAGKLQSGTFQLNCLTDSLTIGDGFSGAPVFIEEKLAGIIVAIIDVDNISPIGYVSSLIPISKIYAAFTENIENAVETYTIDNKKKNYQNDISSILNKNTTSTSKIDEINLLKEKLDVIYLDAQLKRWEIEYALFCQSLLVSLNLRKYSKLPDSPVEIVGRKEEIASVCSNLFKETKGVSLSGITGLRGMGGVGKSALALAICHEIAVSSGMRMSCINQEIASKIKTHKPNGAFSDGILWFEFKKDETLELFIKNQLIAQLKIYLEDIYSTLPPADELLESYFKLLEGLDILIVLDSVEQNKDLFKKVFQKALNCKLTVLITSREIDFITDIKFTYINALDYEKSVLLFRSITKEEINDSEDIRALNTLFVKVGYLPKAIEILAKHKIDKNIGIQQLIKDFESDILDNIPENESPNARILAVIEISYQFLTEDQKKVFTCCGIQNYAFTEDTIKEHPFLKKNKINPSLALLEKKSLIIKEKDGFYSLHPLNREFATKEAIRLGFIDELKDGQVATLLAKNTWNENEINEVFTSSISYLEAKGDNDRILLFNDKLNDFLYKEGYWLRKVELNEKAIKLLQHDENDNLKIYRISISLAQTYGRKGDHEKGLRLYETASIIAFEKEEWEEYFYSKYFIAAELNNFGKQENAVLTCFRNIREVLSSNRIDHARRKFYAAINARTLWWNYSDYRTPLISPLLPNLLQIDKRSFDNVLRFTDYKRNLWFTNRFSSEYYSFYQYLENKNFSSEEDTNWILKEINEVIIDLNILKCFVGDSFQESDDAFENRVKDLEQQSEKFDIKEDRDFINKAKAVLHYKKEEFIKSIEKLDNIKDLANKDFSKWYWLARTTLKLYNGTDIDDKYKLTVNFYLEELLKVCKNLQSVKDFSDYLILQAAYLSQQGDKIAAYHYYLSAEEIKTNSEIEISEFDNKIFTQIDCTTSLKAANKIPLIQPPFELLPSYFIQNLPEIVYDKNGKEMILVKEGLVSFGEKENPSDNINFFFENKEIMNEIWENKVQEKYNDTYYLYPFYIDAECVYNENKSINTTSSFKEAVVFLESLGKILPNEIEMQKALQLDQPINEDIKKHYYFDDLSCVPDFIQNIFGKEISIKIANEDTIDMCINDYGAKETLDILMYKLIALAPYFDTPQKQWGLLDKLPNLTEGQKIKLSKRFLSDIIEMCTIYEKPNENNDLFSYFRFRFSQWKKVIAKHISNKYTGILVGAEWEHLVTHETYSMNQKRTLPFLFDTTLGFRGVIPIYSKQEYDRLKYEEVIFETKNI